MPPSAQARPARILVADDDRDAVRSLLTLLELEGFEARGFYNGFDVIQEVQASGADAVLLDIGMPELDGYTVARDLRRRYASARPLLIAVTARSTRLDEALAKIAGFDHHVTDPCRMTTGHGWQAPSESAQNKGMRRGFGQTVYTEDRRAPYCRRRKQTKAAGIPLHPRRPEIRVDGARPPKQSPPRQSVSPLQ